LRTRSSVLGRAGLGFACSLWTVVTVGLTWQSCARPTPPRESNSPAPNPPPSRDAAGAENEGTGWAQSGALEATLDVRRPCVSVCAGGLCSDDDGIPAVLRLRNTGRRRVLALFAGSEVSQSRFPGGLMNSHGDFSRSCPDSIWVDELRLVIALDPGDEVVRPLPLFGLVQALHLTEGGQYGVREQLLSREFDQVAFRTDVTGLSTLEADAAHSIGAFCDTPDTGAGRSGCIMSFPADCVRWVFGDAVWWRPDGAQLPSNEALVGIQTDGHRCPNAPASAVADPCDSLSLTLIGGSELLATEGPYPAVADTYRLQVVFQRCVEGGPIVVETSFGRTLDLVFWTKASGGQACSTSLRLPAGFGFLGSNVSYADLRLVPGGGARSLWWREGEDPEVGLGLVGFPGAEACKVPGWFWAEATLYGARPKTVWALRHERTFEVLQNVPGAVEHRGPDGGQVLAVEVAAATVARDIFGAELWPSEDVEDGLASLRSNRVLVCVRREREQCPPPPPSQASVEGRDEGADGVPIDGN
jgi:hypothetical protein